MRRLPIIAALLFATTPAAAQPYPNKVVRILTTEAGSGTEMSVRLRLPLADPAQIKTDEQAHAALAAHNSGSVTETRPRQQLEHPERHCKASPRTASASMRSANT